MPLAKFEPRTSLIDETKGVRFLIYDADRPVSVFVSRHALEDIALPGQCDGHIERFDDYRLQFERIAKEKYDAGLVENDGTICIRGRDLPGKGY